MYREETVTANAWQTNEVLFIGSEEVCNRRRDKVLFIGLPGIGCNRLFLLHCKWLLVRNTEEV